MPLPPRALRWPPVSAGALVLASLAGCSSGSAAGTGQGPRGNLPVSVIQVERQDLTREVVLAGSVEPVRSIEVNSRAAGTVLTVRVQEGDRVRQGQLMLELDARETAAQLERARAVLANAEAAFRRSEEMHRAAIITSAEFEQARATFQTAGSDVNLWETRLDFTRVRAPSAGVVTAKLIEAGSAVNPNQRLFDIADDALMVVRVQMSELDVVHVQERDVVRVTLDAHPDAVLRGSVRRIFPSADPTTRLLPVEVALHEPPPGVTVRPGYLARVHLTLDSRPGVLVIPAAAVGASTTGPFAYLVEADTLVRRPITVGLTSSGMVEVVTGLEPGALVVTSGHLGLRAGVTVRIMNRAALSPDGGEEIRNP